MEKEISTQVKIRFSDCDPIGHLNNVKYLEYMMNAREDHVEMFYGFTYEEYIKKTGCTWITVQNDIAYLKEVQANTRVYITSKTIKITDRVDVVEILMKSLDGNIIHAVLWTTVIYFNMKTRRSEIQPEGIKNLFGKYMEKSEQENFADRVKYFRTYNASNKLS